MIRAAQLDAALYEEVEADYSALRQATEAVILSSLAAGVGSRSSGVPSGLVATSLAALLGWYLWAYLTYLIGTRWLPEPHTEADWGQLLRTIGFSSAPGVLRVVGREQPAGIAPTTLAARAALFSCSRRTYPTPSISSNLRGARTWSLSLRKSLFLLTFRENKR